ncbi:hypothetical protein TNCV_2740611 [Trichonephila clavipes]|nr:hypothetical protein TNCV_2740611 [Trichonephila clavipes]
MHTKDHTGHWNELGEVIRFETYGVPCFILEDRSVAGEVVVNAVGIHKLSLNSCYESCIRLFYTSEDGQLYGKIIVIQNVLFE